MPKKPIPYSFSWRIVFGDTDDYRGFMKGKYVPSDWSTPDKVVIGQHGFNFIMIMKSEFFTGMTDQAFVDLFCETYERCDRKIRDCDSITHLEMEALALEDGQEITVPEDVMAKIFRVRDIIGAGPNNAIRDVIAGVANETKKEGEDGA